jgi:hypothetical protein
MPRESEAIHRRDNDSGSLRRMHSSRWRLRRCVTSSLPGLTRLRGRSPFGAAKARQAIIFARGFLQGPMDTRVKPAYDDLSLYSAACCATVGSVPATVARRMSRGCDWS